MAFVPLISPSPFISSTSSSSLVSFTSKRSTFLKSSVPLFHEPPKQRNSNYRFVTNCTISETNINAEVHQENVVGGGVTPTADKFKNYDGTDLEGFLQMASQPNVRMVPMWHKVFSDHLTPVTAYRCLVSDSDLTTPSFLLESVPTPEQVGRYSLIGTRPVRKVVAYEHDVTITDYQHSPYIDDQTKNNEIINETKLISDDPWKVVSEMSQEFKPAEAPNDLPGGQQVFNGGWVGYGGYDTMRYAELKSLPFSSAPKDDRNLPDLHLGLYLDVVLFDHLQKLIYVIHWVDLSSYPSSSPSGTSRTRDDLIQIHSQASSHLETNVNIILKGVPLSRHPVGRVSLNVNAGTGNECKSNMTKQEFMNALDKIHEHLCEGDTFQTVFSQRFERESDINPFNVYRSLRIINPSPYMIYMQCKDCVLVASSPEILTRVVDRILTNRPLAGTRRRGTNAEEDKQLAEELLNDGKDRSEHMMLVDLGRNDVGNVTEYGSVTPEKIMNVERYSHVMHISSTITGKLRPHLTSWDALRSTLPAGTISGAPKIRSMQIIDELEPTKRGPYGGGIGYVSFYDSMNIALALRTMIVPTKKNEQSQKWTYYLQAGAGIVYESDPESEFRETVNKAMALSRAIDLAEDAF